MRVFPPRRSVAQKRRGLSASRYFFFGQHDSNGLFRLTAPGRPHTFRHVFAEVREAAVLGVPAAADRETLPAMPSCAALRFMELRHTAITRRHGAGVDALGISRISGHSPKTVHAIIDKH